MKGKKLKILSLLLGATLSLGAFAACGGNGGEKKDETPDREEVIGTACEGSHKFINNVCTRCSAIDLNAKMTDVATHDPSIYTAYVDENGIVSSTKREGTKEVYFIFGTQWEMSYSFDLMKWTRFDALLYEEGTESRTKNYHDALKTASEWGPLKNSDEVKGNSWAADIIFNKHLGKWCIYYSLNHDDDWRTVDVMLTSDYITGPYSYAGDVVYSGFGNDTEGAGNDDYKKVTGDEEVADRYLDGMSYTGDYGVSAIDPNVFYDDDGELWMVYGSWSGGIFLLKLDNNTGLRDYSYDYGYKAEDFEEDGAVWDGDRLLYDPYMGIHLAGGYYVSGEGPYICKLDDYYYLFLSYGFYSPEGGYNMRVFRSKDLKGPYTDLSGDSAIYAKRVNNYGTNTDIGVSIMSSCKWDWMDKAYLSQGHNSAFVDVDGKAYLVYHVKYNDGTAGHNVEVHQLVKNEQGWYLPMPFEKSKADEILSSATAAEVAGEYGVIIHRGVSGFGLLKYNAEETLTLNADGTLSGALEGTWSVNGGNLTLNTKTDGSFKCALVKQNKEGLEEVVLAFTGMNENELTLWGYQR